MPDEQPTNSSTPPGETQGNGETPQPENQQPNFDAWLASQDDATRSLLDTHTSGLRSALDSERQQRKELAKQLRELTGKLDANSEAGQKLGEISSQLEAAQARADFYEALGPGCLNPKLAYLAYTTDGLKSIEQLKAAYPQLFATAKPPPTNGGAGTRGNQSPASGMNEFIRRSAGR